MAVNLVAERETASTERVCNIVTPVGMLGYGFSLSQTKAALQCLLAKDTSCPTALILDSGSTDSGPSKLALGGMSCPRSAYMRDLSKLCQLVYEFGVPLIFSSAGGDGSNEHVEEMITVLQDIVDKDDNAHYRFKTIAIFSEIQKTLVLDRLRSGAISGCGTVVPALTEDDIEHAPRIVSQMGPEPFLDAMQAHPDFNIIVGGRAYDPAPYVAFTAFASKTSLTDTLSKESRKLLGGFTHMAKIMECGGTCAKPKSHGVSATIYADGTFDLTPHDDGARCTPTSVAAHTLYENSRPDLLHGPGGWLDLTRAIYEQLEDGRTCRVRGGEFISSRNAERPYQIKLEGARTIGFRSMFMGSINDPILTRQLEWLIEKRVKPYVRSQHQDTKSEWDLDFHLYGQNQVSTEQETLGQPGQVFLVGETLASTQDLASSIATTANLAMGHGSYPGQKATSGNLAWGIGGKRQIEMGPCAEFCIYHLMNLEDGEERLRSSSCGRGLFFHTVQVLGKGQSQLLKGCVPNADPIMEDSSQSKTPKMASGPVAKPTVSQQISPMTLGDISAVLRSKNAGPYEITFDVMFESERIYQMVKKVDVLDRSNIARLLGVQEQDIIWFGFFDQARAFKVTIPRLHRGKVVPNGSYMEDDIWAAQRYMPLMNMKLPEDFIAQWKVDTKLDAAFN